MPCISSQVLFPVRTGTVLLPINMMLWKKFMSLFPHLKVMRRIRKCVQFTVDSCTCSTAAASFLKVIIKPSFLQVSINLNTGRCHCKTKQICCVFFHWFLAMSCCICIPNLIGTELLWALDVWLDSMWIWKYYLKLGNKCSVKSYFSPGSFFFSNSFL